MANLVDDQHWRGRRVFVTGAAGLLGGWVVQRLVASGSEVIALRRDRVPMSRLEESTIAGAITVVDGAVEDHDLMLRVLNEYEINTVMHLAAQTVVTAANRSPLSTFTSNIAGTWSLLEACRLTTGVAAVVVASSDKAYGKADTLPYDEDTALRGSHPYDVSKSCADLIAQSYYTTFGLPVSVIRAGNLFGPGDLNFSRIVPGTIRSVLRGERPVIRSDGLLRRDYIYVEDVADAYVLLARAVATGSQAYGRAFNVSNEEPRSVREIVDEVLEVMGRRDLEVEVLNAAPHEIRDQFLAAGRIREELGWRPSFTLRAGLERTVEWYRDTVRASTVSASPVAR